MILSRFVFNKIFKKEDTSIIGWVFRLKCVNFTWAVCKVRGLSLLLRVGTPWRCGDGLFFEVPPLAGDAHLTTLHPLLENML
jgi:hypothetical protein